MIIPSVEEQIGIETFLTSTPGLKGKLRFIPEDFIVTEDSKLPPEKKNGRYTIAIVTSTNWETNQLIHKISKQLYISRKRISFAGTKDKRAKTTQIMSFYNIPIEKIENLNIKDVEIKNIYRSDKSLHLGDLHGNHFDIILRDIDKPVEEIKQVLREIEIYNGFPNFFGIQRFGVIRPITHLVGKQLVLANFREAVWIYLTWIDEREGEPAISARKALLETNDYKEALKLYPISLHFERAMLNHLSTHPDDYIGALQALPRNLLTMFISAYQSYLFNKILSKRISKGLPINQAVIGDIVLPMRYGRITDEEIPVTERNLEKVNKQISGNKGFVSGILVGSESRFADGEMGEIEYKVVEEEKIDIRDFVIPEIPFISSYGTRRILFAPIRNLFYSIREDEFNPDKKALALSFNLLKGCYATSFLREIMKADDIYSY